MPYRSSTTVTAQQGRVIDIKESETDIARFSPPKYMEATLRNRGQARLDTKGNVETKDGDRWIGGNPFPDGESARKIVAGHALCWSRRDASCSPSMEWDLGADDNELFNYHFLFVEYMAAARTVLDPKPYLPGHDGRLKYVSFVLTARAFRRYCGGHGKQGNRFGAEHCLVARDPANYIGQRFLPRLLLVPLSRDHECRSTSLQLCVE